MERKGHILSFDLVKNSGVILSENRKEYAFQSPQIIGKIPELNNYPAVIIELKKDIIVSVSYDADTPRLREAPRRGHKLLGAAKCPKCTWRLPILPDKQIPKVRSGEQFECPDCKTPLRLNSAFIGFHHYAAVGILVVPFVIRRILLRSNELFSVETFAILNTASLWFIPIQILLFFYLYYQEELVIDHEAEVFT